MKLLISAYACRPEMGSEAAVGWNWVCELSKKYKLFVLTNYTNKPYIENYLKREKGKLNKIEFIYIRPNKLLTFWYKEWKRGERLYYFFWQHAALKKAKVLNQIECFDLVQHLTYVTCIMPTYMYKLGIPFVYGPISGGENIPPIIKYPLSKKERIIETVRSMTQRMAKISINTHNAFKAANKIIAVTDETVKLIPPKYYDKTVITQAISLKDEFFASTPNFKKKHSAVKILMAGRMLYWKGFELGIEAFKLAYKSGANIELTILGTGSKKYSQKLQLLAGDLYGTVVQFIDKIEYEKMQEFYEQFDILLNCSLRDSGCMVVMEAMGRGLPVICIDTGGPKVNTNNECAYKIIPQEFSNMRDQIASALVELANNPTKREIMGKAAYEYAWRKFKNSSKIEAFQKIYSDVVKNQ